MKRVPFGIMYDRVIDCGFGRCPNSFFVDREDAEERLNEIFGKN